MCSMSPGPPAVVWSVSNEQLGAWPTILAAQHDLERKGKERKEHHLDMLLLVTTLGSTRC